MVRIVTFISAVALFSTLASGAPSLKRRQDDSAIGDEVGVSAPDGIPITNAGELASQRARESGQTQTSSSSAPVITTTGYGAAYGNAPSAKVEHQTTTEAHQTTSSSAVHTPSSSAHTSSPVKHTSSSVAHTTSASHTTTTHSTSVALPTHGSGSASWGNQAYNDCVQQCIATHGAPGAQYKPTATAPAASSAGSTGTGATHTVIVAPTQGVLRYIPFAVNATVGDTIKFMWGANNHTVTKGSALLPCNRTTDAVFASGVQNKDFTFTQVVNETTPTYFFCGTPGHCQKGMFGIINPTTNFNSVGSVSGQLPSIAANNSAVMGYAAYTAKQTESNPAAAKWGSNIDMTAFPDWAQASVAENVLYTRNFLAQNPEVMKDDGSIDLSTAGSTPLVIPQDIAAALASTTPAATTPSPAETPAAEIPAETPAPAVDSANLNNSALSGNSPRLLVAVMAVFATFVLL